LNLTRRDPPVALSRFSERADAVLARVLPREDAPPADLHRAMRYAVLGGGKRLRPVLVHVTGQALGAESERMDSAAAAVEIIHAYSLVHDDLPAMDDDDLRRGRPTCHVAFGEAMAILAGDALQALAFEILAGDECLRIDSGIHVEMLRTLAAA
jgi:farnesyl diphosphate synthase